MNMITSLVGKSHYLQKLPKILEQLQMGFLSR